MAKTDSFISVVVPLHNNGKIIEQFVRDLSKILEKYYYDYEILLVDAYSQDESSIIIDKMISEVQFIRYIRLSDAVDHEVVCAAGLENAIGDILVLINPENDPIDIIPKAVDKVLSGLDVLVGITSTKKNLFYNFMSTIFRNVIGSFIDYNIPKNATSFRVLSRRALLDILSKKKYLHQLFINISRTGYKIGDFAYLPVANKGRLYNRNLLTGFRKAMSVMVFNSTLPLRFINLFGVMGSFLGILISLFSLLLKLFTDIPVPGWTSLSLFISIQFSIMFLILFFYGEYMARLVDERWDQHEYNVLFEKQSSVMVNSNRWNIIKS
jgi:polyisoprenyl-phosphate glycosyltransferase